MARSAAVSPSSPSCRVPGSQHRHRTTSPDPTSQRWREDKVLELRLEGVGRKEIAARLKLSVRAVTAALHRALGRLDEKARARAEIVRAEEVARLDALIAQWLPAAKADLAAAELVGKWQARRTQLVGGDAPKQHVINARISADGGHGGQQIAARGVKLTLPEIDIVKGWLCGVPVEQVTAQRVLTSGAVATRALPPVAAPDHARVIEGEIVEQGGSEDRA